MNFRECQQHFWSLFETAPIHHPPASSSLPFVPFPFLSPWVGVERVRHHAGPLGRDLEPDAGRPPGRTQCEGLAALLAVRTPP